MTMIVSIEEAVKQLSQLVEDARRGEDVILTDSSEPVARLIPVPPADKAEKHQPRFGSAKGLIVHMAADFDAPLDDFRDYMP